MGYIYHIIRRGARGADIVRDNKDRDLFLARLYYFNHRGGLANWKREAIELNRPDKFSWPKSWSKQDPRVDIYAYHLHNNHFHLLLEEREYGDASLFMHNVVLSMSHHFNKKYKEKGTLFQRDSIPRYITNDLYLYNINLYIHIKNVLELYPGGLKSALLDFDKAFDFATKYKYNSLSAYVAGSKDAILSSDMLKVKFDNVDHFKSLAREYLERYLDNEESGEHSHDEYFYMKIAKNV